MIITANLLRSCMYWLTDISVYKSRINKMVLGADAFKLRMNAVGVNKKYACFMVKIETTKDKLNDLERTVVNIIRQSTHHTNYVAKAEFARHNEDEVYENM